MIKRKQRIPLRDLSTLNAEDRATVEKNAMNGQIFNIFKVLAHHPGLVKRWTPFAGHILSNSTIGAADTTRLASIWRARIFRAGVDGILTGQ